MTGTREAPQMPKRKLTRDEREARDQAKAAKKAQRLAQTYKKQPRQFKAVGIVAGTTPRGMTYADDMLQSIQHVHASNWKLWRDIRKWNRGISDKPVEYETVPEQAGWNDWSRSWWRQAIPSHPSAQRSNPIMKTRSPSIRDKFAHDRARNKGVQAPIHP